MFDSSILFKYMFGTYVMHLDIGRDDGDDYDHRESGNEDYDK